MLAAAGLLIGLPVLALVVVLLAADLSDREYDDELPRVHQVAEPLGDRPPAEPVP